MANGRFGRRRPFPPFFLPSSSAEKLKKLHLIQLPAKKKKERKEKNYSFSAAACFDRLGGKKELKGMGKRGLSEQGEEEEKIVSNQFGPLSLSFSVRVYLSSCCPRFSFPFSAAENQPFYLERKLSAVDQLAVGSRKRKGSFPRSHATNCLTSPSRFPEN